MESGKSVDDFADIFASFFEASREVPIRPPNGITGEFTGILNPSNSAPIFRGPRGGYFYCNSDNSKRYLRRGEFTVFQTAAQIEDSFSSLETTREILYNRNEPTDPLQVERANQQWQGLLEPFRACLWQNQLNAHRVVFQAAAFQTVALPAAAPQVIQPSILPPNGFPGTYTGHFNRNGSPIFRGPRGGIFYVTAGGNRCSITLGQFATIEAMSQRMVYV